MMEALPRLHTVSSFLLTYLVHSTLAIVLMGAVLRCCCMGKPDLRVWLWKAVLLLPVVTSIAASFAGVPHFGMQWTLDDSSAVLSSERLVATASGESERSAAAAFTDLPNRWESNARPRLALAEQEPVALAEETASAKTGPVIWSLGSWAWIAGALIAAFGLAAQANRLRLLRQRSVTAEEDLLRAEADTLSRQIGLRSAVELLMADREGPLAAGILRPFILLPRRFVRLLSHRERNALLAHELAHLARRDPVWNLIGLLICRLFFFQPLNRIAYRQLKSEMEFLADSRAAQVLGTNSELVNCLVRLGDWMSSGSHAHKLPPLAVGMATFRSTLGRRVETLLASTAAPTANGGQNLSHSPQALRMIAVALVSTTAMATIAFAPRAVAHPRPADHSQERTHTMKRNLTSLAVLAGLALPAGAEDETPSTPQQTAAPVQKTTADKLPEGMHRFNGMLVGRIVKKDVEKGTFVLAVDAVPRVWNNSKAENPKSALGKNVAVDGVFGKWLDVLLVIKEGETLEFEARHDGGEQLTFPGELLRKVAPVKPGDYPELPEAFRGFEGVLLSRIIKKDVETFELIAKVQKVEQTWKNNQAKKPESIVGKSVMLAGFWRRKETYQNLKVGDVIRTGVQHIQKRSDHLSVAEFVRKVEETKPAGTVKSTIGFPAELRGFRGVLAGRLVSKDVEKGEFVIHVDDVPRVWKRNEAARPEAAKDRKLTVRKVAGKHLDVLLLLKPGERLEVGAFHNGGEAFDFPGELLKKIED